jgi:RNA polymerase sigma-70 factor (ECF subfamily)
MAGERPMAGEIDERLLIEAAQADPRRFAELYELHFERVYSYVARRVRGRAEVEDITADVFHRALAGLARYEWRGAPFAAWLYRIAANAIVDRAQDAARESDTPPDCAAEDPGLEDVERRASLYRLVRQLPPDQRRVLEWRFAGQKSIREIAALLDRSEGAVKQLQFRALETLRALVGQDDG